MNSGSNGMDPTPQNSPRPVLEVRGARASSVIVQRIPADGVDAFMAWQHGISAAAAEYPGYQTTEVYPPSGTQEKWVIILHFDDPRSMQVWLDSEKRAEWIAKFPLDRQDFQLKMVPTGFGPWFTGLDDESEATAPPSWKMALMVLVTLYPTVMLLAIFVGPSLNPLGLAVSMLVSNALSVSLLQWVVMPMLNPLLGPWLRANDAKQRSHSVRGVVVIVVVLGALAALFRLTKG